MLLRLVYWQSEYRMAPFSCNHQGLSDYHPRENLHYELRMYPTQILNGKVDRDIRDESGVMRGSRTPGILRCFAYSRLSMKAGDHCDDTQIR